LNAAILQRRVIKAWILLIRAYYVKKAVVILVKLIKVNWVKNIAVEFLVFLQNDFDFRYFLVGLL
jgi:hypothetical protein